MEKSSAAIGSTARKRPRQIATANAAANPGWIDAEMRAILDRPVGFRRAAKIMRAVLLTAIAVPLVKIVWIIVALA